MSCNSSLSRPQLAVCIGTASDNPSFTPHPYLAVLANVNFEGADLSDTLMDRAVIVEANLRDAVLQRAVLTSSDLRDADIFGVCAAVWRVHLMPISP